MTLRQTKQTILFSTDDILAWAEKDFESYSGTKIDNDCRYDINYIKHEEKLEITFTTYHDKNMSGGTAAEPPSLKEPTTIKEIADAIDAKDRTKCNCRHIQVEKAESGHNINCKVYKEAAIEFQKNVIKK